MNALPNTQSAAVATHEPFHITPKPGSEFSTFKISPLQHNYQDHPLMQLPRLAELARSLQKTNQCRFIVPGTKQDSSFDHKAQSADGRTVDDVFARIEESGSWIALYNVETDPTYAKWLREVTDTMKAFIEPQQPDVFKVGGFIFISAPPSVTPFHIDRENNLWMQIAGRKIINVWDHNDRHVVSAEDVDGFVKWGWLENVRLRDGYTERSQEFDVGPGDGVYFPSTSPHMTRTTTDWVRKGDGVSISIGVVFYTRHTYKHSNIHAFNYVLRKLGLKPSLPGHNAFIDTLKFWAGRAYVWLAKTFFGYKPVAGMTMPKG